MFWEFIRQTESIRNSALHYVRYVCTHSFTFIIIIKILLYYISGKIQPPSFDHVHFTHFHIFIHSFILDFVLIFLSFIFYFIIFFFVIWISWIQNSCINDMIMPYIMYSDYYLFLIFSCFYLLIILYRSTIFRLYSVHLSIPYIY